MKRTLAEELAELASTGPAPEIDPEDVDFGTFAGAADHDDDDADAGGFQMPSKHLRGEMSNMGREYSGQRTSVSSAFGHGSVSSDGDYSDASNASDSLASSEDDEDLPPVLEQPSGSYGDVAHSSDTDGEVHPASLVNGHQHSPAILQPPGSPDENYEVDALEREFDDVAATDIAAAAGHAAKIAAERVRGAAAGRQRKLWERALELRIRGQRAVSAAHRLPPPEAHEEAASASEPMAAAFSAAAGAASALVGELIDLQTALVNQNAAIAEAARTIGTDGSNSARSPPDATEHGESQAAAQMWARIEAATARWAPYRDASLDRWHRRAALSGGAAAGKPGLKALSQALSAQVAAAVAAPGHIQRLQLLRSNAQPVLCYPSARADDDAAASDGSDAEAIAAADVGRGTEPERVPHTYDDADLYDQLLKAYLDSAAPGAGVALQRQPKRRKVVDRRASKGRKLRYHVHDKLVGFMAPVHQSSHVDGLGPALFINLFGQRQATIVAAT